MKRAMFLRPPGGRKKPFEPVPVEPVDSRAVTVDSEAAGNIIDNEQRLTVPIPYLREAFRQSLEQHWPQPELVMHRAFGFDFDEVEYNIRERFFTLRDTRTGATFVVTQRMLDTNPFDARYLQQLAGRGLNGSS